MIDSIGCMCVNEVESLEGIGVKGWLLLQYSFWMVLPFGVFFRVSYTPKKKKKEKSIKMEGKSWRWMSLE